MFRLKQGDICPGKGIGQIKLGMSFEEVKKFIAEFEIEDLAHATVIVCGDVKIWFGNVADACTQILVYDDFSGKLAGEIGIGSTVNDIKMVLRADCYEDLDVYFIKGIDGICFDLIDSGDNSWNEQTAPIGYIAVYSNVDAHI